MSKTSLRYAQIVMTRYIDQKLRTRTGEMNRAPSSEQTHADDLPKLGGISFPMSPFPHINILVPDTYRIETKQQLVFTPASARGVNDCCSICWGIVRRSPRLM